MSKSMTYVPEYADGVLPEWATGWSHIPQYDGDCGAWPVRDLGILRVEDGDGVGPQVYSDLLDDEGHIDDPAVARAFALALLEAADIIERVQAAGR